MGVRKQQFRRPVRLTCQHLDDSPDGLRRPNAMTTSRITLRALSAFNSSTRCWTPITTPRNPPIPAQTQQLLPEALKPSFSLTTWNIDAFSPRPVARASLILSSILGVEDSSDSKSLSSSPNPDPEHPDIIFLQEVTSDVHHSILDNPAVRKAFLVTDAEDRTSFDRVPFAKMILLSKKSFAFDMGSQMNQPEDGTKFMLGPVSRVNLPSKFGRCAFSVDIIPPSTSPSQSPIYRLINVHLDSLFTLPYRTEQLKILSNHLREPGCSGGIIAGDFNAITTDDHALLEKNGMVDAWLALHGHDGEDGDGATWGIRAGRRDGLKPKRLDKVALLGSVQPLSMEILRPGLIEVPKPGKDSSYIPCSDHSGLKLRFALL